VDARLHHLQGKTERVNDLLELLQAFRREKLEMLLRHEAAALSIPQYDINNTYQYVVNREEVQVTWLTSAIADLGGAIDDHVETPTRQLTGKAATRWRELPESDARDAQAFVDRWKPRVEAMTHARHRGMLRVILGETLEQKRFFEQAVAGELDLLGRRPDHVGPRVGDVLATRWIE
jgi:hypothetical protein